jgi:hypothetical protein
VCVVLQMGSEVIPLYKLSTRMPKQIYMRVTDPLALALLRVDHKAPFNAKLVVNCREVS